MNKYYSNFYYKKEKKYNAKYMDNKYKKKICNEELDNISDLEELVRLESKIAYSKYLKSKN